MREMKDSGIEWIGDIPNDWDMIAIKYLFNTIGSGTTPNSSNREYYDGDYYWLQTGDLNDSIVETTSKKISQKALDECSALTLYHKGAIVIALYGATIGKLGILNIDAYTNQACCVMQDGLCVNSKYIYYWLLCNRDNIIRMSFGGGQPNINQGIISALKVSLPPNINIQNKIVDYLDKKCAEIDSIIKGKEKQNKSLEEYRKSLIYEAVTKGINPNVPMKDSGIEWIDKIPEHWSTKRLKDKFTFGKGLPITKENLISQGISVISYGQIHSKENFGLKIQDNLIRYVSEIYLQSNSNSLVNKGDFIFADTSEDLEGCGNCIYIDKQIKLFAGYHTIILFNKKNVDNRYLAYLFKTDCWRSQLRANVFGIKVFSITQKFLKNTSLIMPPQEECAQIADYLDKKCEKIDNLIKGNKELIENLKEYKKSLIYEAVTGKIEIE